MVHGIFENVSRQLKTKLNKLVGCFSVIGVTISLLYFSKLGILSELVTSEEDRYSQLSCEFDRSPEFNTNEHFFRIDEQKMMQTNEIVSDIFVINYDQYPITMIRSKFFDKTGANHEIPYIPWEVQKYNSTKRDICVTKRTRFFPQLAKSVRTNKWFVIVNGPGSKDQTVAIEECVDNNERSSLDEKLLPTWKPHGLKCRQMISKISLIVALDDDVMTKVDFDYKSACLPYK